MKRLHVMLQVADLDRSVDFYRTLFAAEPTLRRPDYAKWLLDDPRLNFSISDRGQPKGLEHLGIEATTEEELGELRTRLAQLVEAATFDEGETTCCYHHSDKTWVTDDQDVSWEIFHTTGTAPTYLGTPAEAACADGCCPSRDAAAP